MAIREGTFYAPWPVIDGKPLNLQWGEIRSNQAELKALARGSVQEMTDGVDELNASRALLGQAYGDLTFRNKYRFFYNKTTEEMTCQQNKGTVDVPVWVDVWQVRESDGQFQIVSQGGISSDAGFYGPGLQSLEEVAESSSSADVSIRNPTKIFFNSDDGFGVQRISGGANHGQPEIVFTQPYGKAQSFEKAGREWKVDHNFGITPVLVQVMDRDDRVVIPDKADVSDPNTAYFYFNDVFRGSVYIASGGIGAASLVPRDPFYLAVRDHLTPASPGNILKPNADLVFDASDFYVNVDLNPAAGGAHKKASISLKPGAGSIGVTFTDGVNHYPDATELNVSGDDFYLSGDASGNPVLNSTGSGGVTAHADLTGLTAPADDHTQYALVDGSRDFSGEIRVSSGSEAAPGYAFPVPNDDCGMWLPAGNTLGFSAGGVLNFALTASQIQLYKHVGMSDTLNVENAVTSEAFYVASGGELGPIGLRVPGGGANLPSMSFVGDLDTGFFNGDPNSINAATGGAERFRITADSIIAFEPAQFAAHVRMEDSLNVENTVTAEGFYLQGGSGGEVSKSGDDILIRSYDGQVVIDDELLVSGKVVAEAFYTTDGGAVGGSITVKETDGDPTVSGVTTIAVANGTLTDDGGGQVTLGAGSNPRFNTVTSEGFYVQSGGELGPVGLRAPSGGSSLPSMSFVDDPDTGFFNGDPNSINVATGGAERFRITADSIIAFEPAHFGAHVRMDDTLSVENAVTAEAFYFETGGGMFSDGTDLNLDPSGGDVVVGGPPTAGDSAIDFQILGVSKYVLGVDDDDDDTFKLSDGAGLGVGDLIEVNATGNVTVAGGVLVGDKVTAEAFYLASGGEVGVGIDVSDENRSYQGATEITFANDDFYLSDAAPVVHLQPRGPQKFDLTHAPVGLWNFEQNLLDSSGNGYTLGVVAGGAHYSNVNGLVGFNYDASTSLTHSTAGTDLEITGDITVQMLLLMSQDVVGSTQKVFTYSGTGDTEANNVLYSLAIEPLTGDFAYSAEYDGGLGIDYDIASGITVGALTHIAMVRTSDEVAFFVNGRQLGATSSGLDAPTGGTASILKLATAGNSWNGTLLSCKIIDSALTDAEVLAEYMRTLGNHWR